MFYFVRGYMFRSLMTIIRPLCESILKMLVTYWDPIKMTNSLRLTHHVLFCARLHVSVLNDHHQALL